MSETAKSAVAYLRNDNRQMEEDDYSQYNEMLKMVCDAATRSIEPQVTAINNARKAMLLHSPQEREAKFIEEVREILNAG